MSSEGVREAREVVLEARGVQQVEAGTMTRGHEVEEGARELHGCREEEFEGGDREHPAELGILGATVNHSPPFWMVKILAGSDGEVSFEKADCDRSRQAVA